MNALILALVIGQQCSGESCPAPGRPVHASGTGWTDRVVRIDSGTGYGTGTIVGTNGQGQALVLTAAHVVKGHATVICETQSGTNYAGRVLGRADEGDLAAVEIAAPPGIGELNFAAEHPASVSLLGYGRDGRLHRHAGRHVGLGVPGGERRPDDEWSFVACSGDSGGPLVDDSGRLAGVLWGATGASTGYGQRTSARSMRIISGGQGGGSYGVSLVKLLDYQRTVTISPFFIKCRIIQTNPPSSPIITTPLPPPSLATPVPILPPAQPIPAPVVVAGPVGPQGPQGIPGQQGLPGLQGLPGTIDPTLAARLAALEAAVAKGINFQATKPDGTLSTPVNKQLGDTVELLPHLVPGTITTPQPPLPTPAR